MWKESKEKKETKKRKEDYPRLTSSIPSFKADYRVHLMPLASALH
jgi:hypothetical protein